MLVIPYNTTSIFPKNFLIYLNDLSKLIPWNTMRTTPSGAADIAQYLSSFEYVVVMPRDSADPLLQQDIQIIEQTLLFNPKMKFYAYIDGMNISDAISPNDPNSQIVSALNDINTNYNSVSMNMAGIYVDNYELLNVGLGTKNGQNFREAQIQFLLETNRRSMSLAFSTPGRYTPTASLPYTGGYTFITNQPWVLSLVANSIPTVLPYDAATNTPIIQSSAPDVIYQVTAAGSALLDGNLVNLAIGNLVLKTLAGSFSVAYCNAIAPNTVSYNATTDLPAISTAPNDTLLCVTIAGNQTINGQSVYLKVGDVVVKDSVGTLYVMSGKGSASLDNFSNLHLYFSERCTIIDLNLYGSAFNNNSNWQGYSKTNDFLSNMLLINKIRLTRQNLGCKFSMALTTTNYVDYESNNFFTPGTNNSPVGPVLAQRFYNLAVFLNADSVATSAFADFYKTENPATNLMVSSLFDWDTKTGPLGTSYYYPLSEMVSMGQGTVAYAANTAVAVKVESNPSNDTSAMVILGNNRVSGQPILLV